MRPDLPHGGGAPPAPFACPGNGYLRNGCPACSQVRRVLCPRCADAGHPPGLFAE